MVRSLARKFRLLPDSLRSRRDPSFEHLCSQAASADQIRSAKYQAWALQIGEGEFHFHRKVWEWVYILEALKQAGAMRPHASAIGFGVGREPIAAVLAAHGVRVLATDQPTQSAEAWQQTAQHAASLEELRNDGICDPGEFERLVSFQRIDMRSLPHNLGQFDCIWSSCCIEHLGSIDAGLDFVVRSAKLLRPGGVAVHTTEFDLANNTPAVTVRDPDTVFYRQRDLEALTLRLRHDGYSIRCNFRVPRSSQEDAFVDVPPYTHTTHLRVAVEKAIATSFGIIVRRPLNA